MKHNIVYDISFNTREYILELNEPLILNDIFQVGVFGFSTYYSIYNINENNNNFRYYNGTDWIYESLTPGMYNIDDIDNKLNQIVRDNQNLEDDVYNIKINMDDVYLKSQITLSNTYRLDLTINNGLNDILGFDKYILTDTDNLSQRKISITNVSRAYLCCDIASGMRLNNRLSYAILSIPLDVYPGEMISINPNRILYYDIISRKIERIKFWLMDFERNILDNQNEKIQFSMHIK